MDAKSYWSVQECRWVHPGTEELYWSVQRCRWEPVGPAADALATPWSVGSADPRVPEQRPAQAAPVEA